MKFLEETYLNTPNDQLIAFAILSIKRKGEDCTFERLVKECFDLFPKSFSFSRYPEWPDSLKLDRPLRDLRHKKIISGKNDTSFKLTGLGDRFAVEIEKKLLSQVVSKKTTFSVGRKEKKLLDSLKSTTEFKLFQKEGENAPISADNLKHVFFGTFETPIEVIRKNIEYLLEIAINSKEEEMATFLKYCLVLIYEKKPSNK